MRPSIWDVLSIVFLAATCFMGFIFMFIFTNPTSALNPFPPPTLPALINIPTSTATLRSLPATWTPGGVPVLFTIAPSSTPQPTTTGFVLPSATETATHTATFTETPTVTETRTPTKSATPTINKTITAMAKQLTEQAQTQAAQQKTQSAQQKTQSAQQTAAAKPTSTNTMTSTPLPPTNTPTEEQVPPEEPTETETSG